MSKELTVYGTTTCEVYVKVTLNDEEIEGLDSDEINELAIERADAHFGGVTGYCGNGGGDKLIGVSGSNESIDCTGYVEWEYAE